MGFQYPCLLVAGSRSYLIKADILKRMPEQNVESAAWHRMALWNYRLLSSTFLEDVNMQDMQPVQLLAVGR